MIILYLFKYFIIIHLNEINFEYYYFYYYYDFKSFS